MNDENEAIQAILYVLKDEIMRIIIRYCKEPHSSSEIINKVSAVKEADLHEYEAIVGDKLRTLEKAGAILYNQGVWRTNAITLGVLKKYFGE